MRTFPQLLLTSLLPSLAAQAEPATPSPLQILPRQLQIDSALDQPQLLCLETTSQGRSIDLTDEITWTVEPANFATIVTQHGRILLRGLQDGEATLWAQHGQRRSSRTITMRNTGTAPGPSFQNDVLPVLTHAGCNAGGCHGATSGKNGFGLSLFAYDPPRDHLALTRELRGRRIDPAAPQQSLLLQKATGMVPHQGGKRMEPDSSAADLLRSWIAAGATDDQDRAPALVELVLEPGNAVVLIGQRLPLLLRARYADGSDRDVTALTLWSSSVENAVGLAATGVATATGRGESTLLARYGGLATSMQILVLADEAPIAFQPIPTDNPVDRAIEQKLVLARVEPAALCDDATFVRRLHLDLCGQLPEPAAVREFLADARPDKRELLLEDLLQRREFAVRQALAWAEVLRIEPDRMERKGAQLLTDWLVEGFASKRPFDAMVRELLLAEGSSFRDAPVNFWLVAGEPHLLGEHVAQNLLGVRLQCAQCHNHPFENWSMDDYYGIAAFFGQIARKRGEDGSEWVLWNRGNGEVRNPRTGKVTAPRLPGAPNVAIERGADRRAVFADWLFGSGQLDFARNIANRLFAQLLGRGLVDPPDDMRLSNPASHPELLTALAQLLVDSGYDLRAVVRAICNSRTYQRAVHTEQPPPELFAGYAVRRLSAEQLLDAIASVTGVANRLPGLPTGSSASEIVQAQSGIRFLDVFGRPRRETACTCERQQEPTLGQALHLLNGDTVAAKLADRNGRLQRALAKGVADAELLEELFLAAFARLPEEVERERLLAVVATVSGAPARLQVWQDLVWALLNTHEFLFQH